MATVKNPGQKGFSMAINRERDRNGQLRIVVSKRWPDKSRFRRYCPNTTVAKKTLARIEESIAMGTWRDLKEELARGVESSITIEQLADIYLREYCPIHNTRPDFKEHALKPIRASLGKIEVQSLRRTHVHQFMTERSKEVSLATVNRKCCRAQEHAHIRSREGVHRGSPTNSISNAA